MPSSYRAFWLARRGNSPEEYEDAFAADAAAGRYAVADGATESCFAGLWARLLVEKSVADTQTDPGDWPACLADLQERWYADVRSRSLPWYAEARVEEGAFATFLGVVLTASPRARPRWQVIAAGDTCLFHTRRNELLRAFPLQKSGQFNSLPRLLGSRMSPEVTREQWTPWVDGSGWPDDRLWMMTDALAHWCLAEHEAGENPWKEMESLLALPEAEQPFASWIEQLRDTRGLRNDDVTLLVVDVQET